MTHSLGDINPLSCQLFLKSVEEDIKAHEEPISEEISQDLSILKIADFASFDVIDSLSLLERHVSQTSQGILVTKIEAFRVDLEKKLFVEFLIPQKNECSLEQLQRFEQLISTFNQNEPLFREIPLIALCAASPNADIRKLAFKCLEHEVSIQSQNRALLYATKRDDFKLIEKLVGEGASPSWKPINRDGTQSDSALSVAISQKKSNFLLVFVKNGLPLDQDYQGDPLWFILLNFLTTPYQGEGDFDLPLINNDHEILKNKVFEFVATLDKKTFNIKDVSDLTILDHALKQKDFNLASQLIEAGSSVTKFPDQLKHIVSKRFKPFNFVKSEKLIQKLMENHFLPFETKTNFPVMDLLRDQNVPQDMKDALLSYWKISPPIFTELKQLTNLAEALIFKEIDYEMFQSSSEFSVTDLKYYFNALRTSIARLEEMGFTGASECLETWKEKIVQLENKLLERERLARDYIKQNQHNLKVVEVPVDTSKLHAIPTSRVSSEKSLSSYLRSDVLSILMQERKFDQVGCFSKMLGYKLGTFDGADKPVFLFALDKNLPTIEWINPEAKGLNGGYAEDNALFLSEALEHAEQEVGVHPEIPREDQEKLMALFTKLKQSVGFLSQFKRYGVQSETQTQTIIDELQDTSRNFPLCFDVGFQKHLMLLIIEKNANSTFKITLTNTGGGVRGNHPRWEKTDKYQTYISYDQIPAQDILKSDYLAKMRMTTISENSPEKIYMLFNELGEKGQIVPPSVNEQDYEQLQWSGTCSAQAGMAFLRYFSMKEFPGSPLEKLGFYKELKAYTIKHLTASRLESIDKKLKIFAEKKIQKCNFDLDLLHIARDIFSYQEIIKSLAEHLDDKKINELITVKTTYARFALLRAALREIAYESTTPLTGLGILSKIIQGRFEKIKDAIDFAEKALDNSVKTDQESTFEIIFNLIILIPPLRKSTLLWLSKQDEEFHSNMQINEYGKKTLAFIKENNL